jgi:hypothetical protein
MHSDSNLKVSELPTNILSYNSTLSSTVPTPNMFTVECRLNGVLGAMTQYFHDVELIKIGN